VFTEHLEHPEHPPLFAILTQRCCWSEKVNILF